MQPVVPNADEWPRSLPRYWPVEGLALVITKEGDFPVAEGLAQPGLQRQTVLRVLPPSALERELLAGPPGEE